MVSRVFLLTGNAPNNTIRTQVESPILCRTLGIITKKANCCLEKQCHYIVALEDSEVFLKKMQTLIYSTKRTAPK